MKTKNAITDPRLVHDWPTLAQCGSSIHDSVAWGVTAWGVTLANWASVITRSLSGTGRASAGERLYSCLTLALCHNTAPMALSIWRLGGMSGNFNFLLRRIQAQEVTCCWLCQLCKVQNFRLWTRVNHSTMWCVSTPACHCKFLIKLSRTHKTIN
jgi:hypothetical protein